MGQKFLMKRECSVMERAWVRRILGSAARLPYLWPVATESAGTCFVDLELHDCYSLSNDTLRFQTFDVTIIHAHNLSQYLISMLT